MSLINNGLAISRDAVLVLPGLPAGVELEGASGSDANGSPYINLQSALPFGGLGHGIRSQAASLSIANPQQQRFILAPEVFVKGPNNAPIWTDIAPLSVNIGGYLSVPLSAEDANGDPVFFKVAGSSELPTGRLDSAGNLVFTPQPGEEGNYGFDLIADDGAEKSFQSITLEVTNDVGTTRLSGVIQNTLQEPLGGVRVEFGAISTITADDGSFLLDLGNNDPFPNETLRVHGDSIPGDVA